MAARRIAPQFFRNAPVKKKKAIFSRLNAGMPRAYLPFGRVVFFYKRILLTNVGGGVE